VSYPLPYIWLEPRIKDDKKELDSTYLPPFFGSFALANLSHIPFIVIPNVSHMRNQQVDRFEKMDRIVYHVSQLCPIPPCHELDLPTTWALRSASSTSGQTAAWHYLSAITLQTNGIKRVGEGSTHLLVLLQSLGLDFDYLAYPFAFVCTR
jgi:hypothetical protein